MSSSVEAGQVVLSLIMFSLIYLLLFVLFIYLLNEKIQHGPVDDEPQAERHMLPKGASSS